MENAAGIFPIARSSWYSVDNGLPNPAFATSVYESRLTGLRQDFRGLKTRNYLAIVESSPEVALGTEHAQQQASLHTVLGSW